MCVCIKMVSFIKSQHNIFVMNRGLENLLSVSVDLTGACVPGKSSVLIASGWRGGFKASALRFEEEVKNHCKSLQWTGAE